MITFVLCLFLAIWTGASALGETIADYNGKDIGVVTGSVQEGYVKQLMPDSQLFYFDSFPDLAVALKQGKISAFIMPQAMSQLQLAENPTLTYLEKPVTSTVIAFGFSQTDTGEKLRMQMNAFLEAKMADGSLEALSKLWFSGEGAEFSQRDLRFEGRLEHGAML